jgi:hypothetical protein
MTLQARVFELSCGERSLRGQHYDAGKQVGVANLFDTCFKSTLACRNTKRVQIDDFHVIL